LQIALAMESDLAGLHFSVLLIDFIAHQDDWNVVTDSGKIFVPFGHVFVGDSGGNIEHQYGGIRPDVVSLTQSS